MYDLLTVLLAEAVLVEGQNKTIVYGWVAEPDDRGTWSIVWSCLATVFICTWSSLHLNVPLEHGAWFLFRRKVRWVLAAVFGPELILVQSFYCFFVARSLLKDSVRYAGTEWTFTHAQFACARGFYAKSSCADAPQKQERERYDPETLKTLAKSSRLTAPPISENELKSRGKSDGIIKLIAVFQIIWFGLQTLVRAIQHLHITALEIITIAYILCSLFIYGFCWSQPQGIEYPIAIEIRTAQPTNGNMMAKPFSESPLISWVTRDRFEAIEGWWIPLMAISASGFGAIHCLAWNLPFPSPAERLA